MASGAGTAGPVGGHSPQGDKSTWTKPPKNPVCPPTGMSMYYKAGTRRSSASSTSRDTSASPASQSRDRKPGSLTYKSSISGVSDRIRVGGRTGSSVSDRSNVGTPSPQTDRPGLVTKTSAPVSRSSTSSSRRSTPSGTSNGGSTQSTVSSCSSYDLQDPGEVTDMDRVTPKFRTVVSIASDRDKSSVFSRSRGGGDASSGVWSAGDEGGDVPRTSIHHSTHGEVLTANRQQTGTPGRHDSGVQLVGDGDKKGVPRGVVSRSESGRDQQATSSSHMSLPASRAVTRAPQLSGCHSDESQTPKRAVLNGDTGSMHTGPNTDPAISLSTAHRATNTEQTTVVTKITALDKTLASGDKYAQSRLKQTEGIGDLPVNGRATGGRKASGVSKDTGSQDTGIRDSTVQGGIDQAPLGGAADAVIMTSRRRPLPNPPSEETQTYDNHTPSTPTSPLNRTDSSSPPPIPPHVQRHKRGSHVHNGHNRISADNNMTPVMVHIAPEPDHLGYVGTHHAHSNGYPPTYTGTGFENCPPYTGASSDISDSLDSDGSSLNLESSGYKFYMDQQVTDIGARRQNGDGALGSSPGSTEHPFLVGQRDIMNPAEVKETKIMSSKGTVRGLKNLVRAGIATFAEKQDGIKNYRHTEAGKVVIYTTTVKIVRETYDRCVKVKKILQTHMIKYEERDIFMSKENHMEYLERIGPDQVDVPQVFADGQYIGGIDEIEKMNESGELRTVFKPFKRFNRHTSCSNCGGFQFTPCTVCHGSKKSQNRNYFMDEFCALRCTHCDENGLIRCDLCTHGEVITS